MLGFEDVERLLERVSKSSQDGYPPYNIERIRDDGDETLHLRITLAVAGFGPGDLDVTVEENELSIRGRQSEETDRDYLHRGIAARQFHRTFVLADGMEVGEADLKDGLLSIDLIRRAPQKMVRRITISKAE